MVAFGGSDRMIEAHGDKDEMECGGRVESVDAVAFKELDEAAVPSGGREGAVKSEQGGEHV